MKIRRQLSLLVALIAMLISLLNPMQTFAFAPSMSAPSGLSIVEIKMTGNEFVLLQNNTGAAIENLSSYWLTVYNNVNPLASGVASATQQLPSVPLGYGATILLSSDPMHTCGAEVAGKLSVSLSDSGGFLQLAFTELNAQGAVVQTPGDIASWSSGASGIIQNMPSNTKDPRAVYYRYFSGGSYVWQQASLDQGDVCQLRVLVAGGSGSSSAVTPLTLAATSPPATILGVQSVGEGGAVMPSGNVGLLAPQLSELLPNPVGTGTDATNEFIELYNPNPKAFELSGFTLYAGATTMRGYTFPVGTMLEPMAFTVFKPEKTKLSLGNTSGQVELADPFGRVLSTSGVYKTAKDGNSWASANGKWQWSSQPTPGAANIIKVVQPKAKSTSVKTKTKLASNIASTNGEQQAGQASAKSFSDAVTEAPVHMWVLALIAGGALLYGAYEYRRDIANRLFQLRGKLGIGRTAWPAFKGRRGD